MNMPESQGDTWRAHLYSQVPLRTRNGDIRLLTIQPRNYPSAAGADVTSGAIPCFLRLANLKTQQTKFTAVSHSCSTDEDESVSINGALIPASSDVVKILAYFQQETRPVTIWIDTVCINHGDVGEMSAQKSQLGELFSAASSVVVWLGPTANDSDEAMSALDRLADEHLTPAAQKLLINALQLLSFRAKVPESAKDSPDTPPQTSTDKQKDFDNQLHKLRVAFQSLMSRKYWSRLWSLQELAFTSKGSVVCGKRALDLDRFYMSAKALDGVLNMATYSRWLAASSTPTPPSILDNTEPANFSASPAIRLLAEREFFRAGHGWWSSTEHTLLSILGRYYLDTTGSRPGFVVEDKRDLIYGFVGLASDANELGLSIEYGKNYKEVCSDTMIALSRKNPRVLQLCLGHDSAGADVPSWVIDWSQVKMPASYRSTGSLNACGLADNRYYKFESNGPGVIAVKGVFVDTISAVSKAQLGSSTHQSDELSKALGDFLRQSLEGDKSPYSEEQAQDVPANMLMGTAFVTKSGYVGCGSGVTDGDSIAIFYGSGVPVALRKQPDGTHRLVGEVYVIGIMQGLKAWVEVDGTQAVEYDHPEANEFEEIPKPPTAMAIKYV
ncbi:hypothetical protein TruAng_007453 [Truncatella angustata]|nr:hypothetical protein TruAng_007453 [Truncatella angustata]